MHVWNWLLHIAAPALVQSLWADVCLFVFVDDAFWIYLYDQSFGLLPPFDHQKHASIPGTYGQTRTPDSG